MLFISGIWFALLQCLAALPWVWAIDPIGMSTRMKKRDFWQVFGSTILGLAAGLTFLMKQRGDSTVLEGYGRIYGSILHLQLLIDAMIVLPHLLLTIWPKGGAVAFAAFREAIRQPMFWLILILSFFLISFSMILPYFTFGEEYKMMKQLGFDISMLAPTLFGLLAASISIYDEIEGRNAITVMSKPINRRQYFLGKYVGILLSCICMALALCWILTWAFHIKPFFDVLEDVDDSMPQECRTALTPFFSNLGISSQGESLAIGVANWVGDACAHHMAMLLVFGQIMVMLGICVALATRMTFVVNLAICLIIFILGRLAPVMVDVTSRTTQDGGTALQLVHFIAQLMNTVFPALENFDVGPAVVREYQLTMTEFAGYVLPVLGYSIIYTLIALFGGLFLFEDRDLA